jgi:rhamnosyltransferase
MPRISIILLTLNGGQRLTNTLEAVLSQQFPADSDDSFEVIAIDSGSTDTTVECLQHYPVQLHQIAPAEFGHGRTRNVGARLAQGEWLVYLTQDAVPAGPHWLANLTRHLRQPAVAAAFGRQLPPAEVGPIETFFLEQTYPDRPFQHLPTTDAHTPIRRIFFSNVNSAIKKEVWEKCPFPEDVVMSEDQAFARAALKAGYTIVYDPEAGVYHGHRYTLEKLFRRNFDSGYSLRDISQDSWRAVVKMGLDYVSAEMRFLVRRGQWTYLPYALVYEIVKSAGFALGRSAHHFPPGWQARFSLHTSYWAKYL